jgi:hypothetical protein
MAKRDMLKNGLTLRNISIIVGILLAVGSAAGGIVWAFAIQSGNLVHVIEDVEDTEAELFAMDMQIGSIQKTVNLNQNNLKHIVKDRAEQKILIKEQFAEQKKLMTKIWDKMNE